MAFWRIGDFIWSQKCGSSHKTLAIAGTTLRTSRNKQDLFVFLTALSRSIVRKHGSSSAPWSLGPSAEGVDNGHAAVQGPESLLSGMQPGRQVSVHRGQQGFGCEPSRSFSHRHQAVLPSVCFYAASEALVIQAAIWGLGSGPWRRC